MRHYGFRGAAGAALVMAAVIACSAIAGCGTKVREVQVDNRPAPDPAGTVTNLKGMSPEMAAHFKGKYPDDSWELAPAPPVIAVGPTVFSRSAISLLEADAGAKDPASALGDSVSLLADAGKANFVMSQKYSPAVQAIVLEVLVEANAFIVKALDDAAGLDLYRGKIRYTNLYEQKVKFFVESNLTADGGPDSPYQVYLRLIDTRSGAVVFAVSASARDVRTAARTAAARLLGRCTAAQ